MTSIGTYICASIGQKRRRWLAMSVGGVAIATLAATTGLGATANATGAKAIHQARPHATESAVRAGAMVPIPVTAFNQEFTTNVQYFCPAGSGNAPCDGAPNDYGTIDRVASKFSNGGYGNYAPSTKAFYKKYMALVSGDGDVNQGMGCPGTTPTSNPGEVCSGPYALFGTGANEGAENVFPAQGFTVTDDLYLSPTTSPVAGSLVDDDVELNNNAGTYGSDDIITACAEATGGSPPLGFVLNFGGGSPGSCAGTPVITTDGWYRFVFEFTNLGGDVYVTESVLSEPSLSLVATSGPQPVSGTPTAVSNWGGPGYFWLPTQDMSGLPLANFALQLGQHPTGYTP